MDEFVETGCTVEHGGKSFTANGASRVGDRLVCYLPCGPDPRVGQRVKLTTWKEGDDSIIGEAVVTGRWAIRGSWISSEMFSLRGTVGGVVYNLRSAGSGMVATGKRARKQPKV